MKEVIDVNEVLTKFACESRELNSNQDFTLFEYSAFLLVYIHI
jgi:hypothetical protein